MAIGNSPVASAPLCKALPYQALALAGPPPIAPGGHAPSAHGSQPSNPPGLMNLTLAPMNIWANRSQQLFLEQLLTRWNSRQGLTVANGAADGLQVVPTANHVMPEPGTPEYDALLAEFQSIEYGFMSGILD